MTFCPSNNTRKDPYEWTNAANNPEYWDNIKKLVTLLRKKGLRVDGILRNTEDTGEPAKSFAVTRVVD